MTIVGSIQRGDHAIFRKVYEEYHSKLYFFILQKTQSTYLAEEVMQLAFIKLWESRHTLKEEFTISTQLFRIASTVLIDLLRKQHTYTKALNNADDPVTSLEAGLRLEEKELQQKITDAVRALPPVRRHVFEMSRHQGKSHQEIADSLAVSVKTVETHIYKALKQIKKHITVWWILLLQHFFLR